MFEIKIIQDFCHVIIQAPPTVDTLLHIIVYKTSVRCILREKYNWLHIGDIVEWTRKYFYFCVKGFKSNETDINITFVKDFKFNNCKIWITG